MVKPKRNKLIIKADKLVIEKGVLCTPFLRDILILLKLKKFGKIFDDLINEEIGSCPTFCLKHCPPNAGLITVIKRFNKFLEFLDCETSKIPEDLTLELYNKNTRNDVLKILPQLLNDIKKRIESKLNKLEFEECFRLSEAVHVFDSECFHSSIVMAVSAVEGRLHLLLKKENKRLYEQYFKDKPLGYLISLFDPNQFKDKKFNKVKKILKDKHKPLINLLNQYRVLSAHPKGELLNRNLSLAILSLSFIFLMDEEMRIKKSKKKIK